MANWNVAYNWMMNFEDAPRACAQVPDASPGGAAGPCFAISGINSGAWPDEFAAIESLPQEQRGPFVQQFYENHFWNKWYAQLVSDEVCKRVFDFAVNGGSGASVHCLQQAVNALAGADGAQLIADGDWGPITVDAANSADPLALTAAFQAARASHYHAIAAANPGKAIYLSGWIARAQK